MNFLIEYILYNNEYPIKEGIIKTKNKNNELEAKIKTEEYLKTKYDFTKFVITSCREDTLDIFDNLFGGFNSNPFRT